MSKVSRSMVVMVVLALGLAVGYGIGYVSFQPRIDRLNEDLIDTSQRLSTAEAEIGQLQNNITRIHSEKAAVDASLLATQQTLSRVNASLANTEQELADTIQEFEAKKDELNSALINYQYALANITVLTNQLALKDDEIDLKDDEIAMKEGRIDALNETINKVKNSLSALENDRVLLVYMREDLPGTRESAKEYWGEVKNLSSQSDPNLRPLVDEVIMFIDPYFDWLDSEPDQGTEEEWEEWFVWDFFYTGAYQYGFAIDDFVNEVYLVIIRHIDEAVRYIG